MATLTPVSEGKPYLTIIGGRITKKVTEDTPGAIRREYEDSKGNKGVKFELQYKEINGKIKDLKYKTHPEYGESLEVVFDEFVLSMNIESKFYKAFAKKIPSADIHKDVALSPYDYEKNGERVIGMSVKQNGIELENFCWDKSKEAYIESYPKFVGQWETATKKDKTLYFLEVEDFLKQLVGSVKERLGETMDSAMDKIASTEPTYATETQLPDRPEEEEVRLEDVPF